MEQLALFPISNLEKHACAEREVKQREYVYPRLVAQGKMTVEFAAEQIRLMKEIAEDYRKLSEK